MTPHAWDSLPGSGKTLNERAMLALVVATLAVPLLVDPGFWPALVFCLAVLGASIACSRWRPSQPAGEMGQLMVCVLGPFGWVFLLFVAQKFLSAVPLVGAAAVGAFLASVGWAFPAAQQRRTICLIGYLPVTFLFFSSLWEHAAPDQQDVLWLLFVVAAVCLAGIAGSASPSGHRLASGGSVLRTATVLVGVALVSMLLSIPVSAVRMKMKDVDFPSFAGAPVISQSSDVVFYATFNGAAPSEPYWRGYDLVYPAPANLFGDWKTHQEVFGQAGPDEGVRAFEGGEYIPGYQEDLRQRADYSFRSFHGRSRVGMHSILVDMDGTVEQEPVSKAEKKSAKSLVEYNVWASEAFRRRKAGGEVFLSDQERERFFKTLNTELQAYVSMPSFDPARGQIPDEMDQTYRLVQSLQSELVAAGKMTGPLTVQSDWKEKKAYVEAVYGYFSQHLKYNFDHQYMSPEKNTLDYFLFEDQRGVCRHFANAFASMMRMGGVPARVVAGYSGGAYDKQTRTYYVRQRDAHAWTEVWLGWEQGWVRVDPTGAAPVEKGIPEDNAAAQWKEGMAFAKGVFAHFSTSGRASGPNGGSAMPSLAAIADVLARYKFWALGIAALVLVAFAGMVALRWRERRAAQCPNQQAWEALLRVVRQFGHDIPGSMGPATLKPLVARELTGEALARWNEAVDGYEQWRFANHASPVLAQTIRQAIPLVRQALKKAQAARGG